MTINTENIQICQFTPPVSKKKIIFLRAPYKNKLARLSILRAEHSLIISLKKNSTLLKHLAHTIINTNHFCGLLTPWAQLNLSTHRTKHSKSTLCINARMPCNFIFKNFN